MIVNLPPVIVQVVQLPQQLFVLLSSKANVLPINGAASPGVGPAVRLLPQHPVIVPVQIVLGGYFHYL